MDQQSTNLRRSRKLNSGDEDLKQSVSQATGFQKPEKEIFNLAAEHLWYESIDDALRWDSYDNDVMGAFTVVGILCGLTTVDVSNQVLPVFDLEIDTWATLFGAGKVLSTFQIINIPLYQW